jgi:drug/metabolite transporter (DMT)-like permease
MVAGAGVFDVTANAAYLAATQRGLLSIVAVLSSLYPASTVVLARIVLAERLHRIQLGGLVLAALGVAAMAAA